MPGQWTNRFNAAADGGSGDDDDDVDCPRTSNTLSTSPAATSTTLTCCSSAAMSRPPPSPRPCGLTPAPRPGDQGGSGRGTGAAQNPSQLTASRHASDETHNSTHDHDDPTSSPSSVPLIPDARPSFFAGRYFSCISLSNLNRFKKSFSLEDSVVILQNLKIPPHLACVATPPCEYSSEIFFNRLRFDRCMVMSLLFRFLGPPCIRKVCVNLAEIVNNIPFPSEGQS